MMVNVLHEKLARALAAKSLLAHRGDMDWLVLSDEVLYAALSGDIPLNRGEMAALLDSPMTLQRLNVLEAERRVAEHSNTTAANDNSWSGSHGLLLAADSGVAAPALNTEDGLWRLSFLSARDGYNMVLQLDLLRPEAAGILASGREIAVLDGADTMVMNGVLDADGELEKPWPLAKESPYVHFMATGGRFNVWPV